MLNNKFLFTSESVSEGHPDKIADQISDAILDAIIEKDIKSRVAAETLCNNEFIVLAGEITTNTNIDYEQIVRNTIKNIGYEDSENSIDYKSCKIVISYIKQSIDIAIGIDNNDHDILSQGAGDQGIMFGYACNETIDLMPAPIYYAHKLMQKHSLVRKSNQISWLRPDAKSQVTFQYINNIPSYIDTIVLSTQHSPNIKYDNIKEAVIEEIILPVIPKNLINYKTKFIINPTGRFVIGGPKGDCGLTGRKIIVDTYGGSCPHGGGAFSGKDPSKVDRSAAYFARYIAKNIVASGIATRCQVQLSYAIGISNPINITINTQNTGLVPDSVLSEYVKNNFDLRPGAIIKTLNLLKPIYYKTASYGHFGRNDKDFTWEYTDKVDIFKKL
ncbi:S-adenosylmethionine synthase [Candidatus Kinetoplastibacterium sorsogonicusi]|uniref:S-adenosylmethionine synthase n=1 Tax=Candidatus Kinetoplastidibacterium kentomonadis TaxID=1576550 RepID=A0A3S7JAR3_9PROT|nr:methionine adenosyltransferase [Candidatus Kinetoplastibacterium sorsogonicusi]AWD32749.1 S-adenosylmethionine synthase [Candidatus Kinetoplastibacterium sorsogonicusi]